MDYLKCFLKAALLYIISYISLNSLFLWYFLLVST